MPQSDIQPELLRFGHKKLIDIMEIDKAASKIFRTVFARIYDITGCSTVFVSVKTDSLEKILADAH